MSDTTSNELKKAMRIRRKYEIVDHFTKNWGVKCEEFEVDCPACIAWRWFEGAGADYLHELVNSERSKTLEMVRGAIGDDDTEVRGTTQNPGNPMYWTKRTKYRNELRQEQRQAIDNLTTQSDSEEE